MWLMISEAKTLDKLNELFYFILGKSGSIDSIFPFEKCLVIFSAVSGKNG